MGIPYFRNDRIATDGYLVLSGTSSPLITTYPRTIGGVIQESGVVEKNISLKAYIIPPKNATRKDLETYFHNLNERIGPQEGTLHVHNNDYLLANVKNIDYDDFITDGFNKFVVNFELNNQNATNTIRQLTCPNLENFSRGRKATFKSQMEDGSYKTFNFWHNVDAIKNFETQLTIKHSKQFGGSSRVIRVGGFEKVILHCWIIGPDISNRRNIEAYFYNMINGPLGKLGTLNIGGNQIIEKAFFTEASMEDTTNRTVRYTLTFLVSLQCELTKLA